MEGRGGGGGGGGGDGGRAGGGNRGGFSLKKHLQKSSGVSNNPPNYTVFNNAVFFA